MTTRIVPIEFDDLSYTLADEKLQDRVNSCGYSLRHPRIDDFFGRGMSRQLEMQVMTTNATASVVQFYTENDPGNVVNSCATRDMCKKNFYPLSLFRPENTLAFEFECSDETLRSGFELSLTTTKNIPVGVYSDEDQRSVYLTVNSTTSTIFCSVAGVFGQGEKSSCETLEWSVQNVDPDNGGTYQTSAVTWATQYAVDADGREEYTL